MEVHCAGCAGCCIDWRALAPSGTDHERRGPHDPLDDAYNLVPLTRDDVRGLLDAGLADATRPRLWRDPDHGISIDGTPVAAIDGKPACFIGLRQPPKPVGPFGTEPQWLPTCTFLDPTTLQCRIHDTDIYPEECGAYPGHNLELGAETECERVEVSFGGDRLLDDEPPAALPPPLFGPQAVGHRIFLHPYPDRLDGVVDRLRREALTQADRAEFVAAALAGSPGTTATNPDVFDRAYELAMEADSWVGRAHADWSRLAATAAADPALAARVETNRGAPPTPGWDD